MLSWWTTQSSGTVEPLSSSETSRYFGPGCGGRGHVHSSKRDPYPYCIVSAVQVIIGKSCGIFQGCWCCLANRAAPNIRCPVKQGSASKTTIVLIKKISRILIESDYIFLRMIQKYLLLNMLFFYIKYSNIICEPKIFDTTSIHDRWVDKIDEAIAHIDNDLYPTRRCYVIVFRCKV